jgi:hypothetical protein
MNDFLTRRSFLQTFGAATLGLSGSALSQEKPIQGFEKAVTDPNA